MSVHQNVKHGYLVNEDTGDVLEFQFNPETYYTEHEAEWTEIESPGAKYRKVAYNGRPVEKFPLTLQFYGVSNIVSGKSSKEIENYLMALVKPKTKQKNIIKNSNHFISPPIVTLCIGPRIWTTVVSRVKITRKLFNKKLKTMSLEAIIEFIVVQLSKPSKPKKPKKKKAGKAGKKKKVNKKKKTTTKKKKKSVGGSSGSKKKTTTKKKKK